MALRRSLQVGRVAALLVVLLLARPVLSRLLQMSQTANTEGLRWLALALVAIPLVFMGVVVVARRTRHPSWLLVVEGVLAALLGLVLPLWGLTDVSGAFAWLPDAVDRAAAAFRHPIGVAVPGLGQAANWLVVVLALAWLVSVVATAVHQRRHPPLWYASSTSAPPSGSVGVRTLTQAGRILALVVLLLVAGWVLTPWSQALTTVEFATLWWTWLALAAIALAFLVGAAAGRGSRHRPWLLAGEALVAAVIAVVLVGPGVIGSFLGPVPAREVVARMLRLPAEVGVTTGMWFYLETLAIAWLVVVADTALRQRRASASQHGEVAS